MFNKVVLVGNLTRDIEMRYAQNGNAIGVSAIAVSRRFTVNGERREETCFIDINFYGRTAEIANQYLFKGSKLLIEGRLRFEQWNDQNGQMRSKHSIQVENMEMLGNQQNFNNSTNYPNYSDLGENAPKKASPSNQQKSSNPNQEKIKEIDINAYSSDDTDLPF